MDSISARYGREVADARQLMLTVGYFTLQVAGL